MLTPNHGTAQRHGDGAHPTETDLRNYWATASAGPLIGPSIADEARIVWLVEAGELERLEYVREAWSPMRSRVRAPSWRAHAGRLVGYAVLAPRARSAWSGVFDRRYWWLSDHDRAVVPFGAYVTSAPVEAVDPLTVAANQVSRCTPRAWFGTERSAEIAEWIARHPHEWGQVAARCAVGAA